MILISLVALIFNSFYLVSTFGQYGENSNSCVDSCGNGFKSNFKIDLRENKHELIDDDLVEILQDNINVADSSVECSKNMLLRIPFLKLANGTIVKISLNFNDFPKGTTLHIGNSPTNDLYGGDRNSTMYNSEIYSNDTNLSFYMSSTNLCDQGYDIDSSSNEITKILFLNESTNYLSPKSRITVYVSEKWFRIDDETEGTSFYFNNDYLFTFSESKTLSENCKKNPMYQYPFNRISPYLYIGLNRAIADQNIQPGSGLCNAEISFLNCFTKQQPDMDINVDEMKYTQVDDDSIIWVNPLNYLEPAMQHTKCSGQGVLKLKFNQKKSRSIARFDLSLGEIISGFIFNIGDSPSNNAYGGDSGSTSNSAELHNNDNRFYVWLNTKYCGDTLLYRIEYNLFQSFDNITLFVSDERIEITNNRGYHEIFKNPYLFNLNGQNVTCNCFDTRCYPGIQPDDDIYFSINRVIGGTFRPGIGLCNAKISWLQCKDLVKSNQINDMTIVDWFNNTQTIQIKNGKPITIQDEVSIDQPSAKDRLINELKLSANQQEQEQMNNHASSSKLNLGQYDKGVPLIIFQNFTILNNTNTTDSVVPRIIENKIEEKFSNPCTQENIDKEILYHEYKFDYNKFIYCEKVKIFKILSCPNGMRWFQNYQQCLE